MKIHLKPCPFCGEKEIWITTVTENCGSYLYVECSKCGAKSSEEDSQDTAVKSWNKRTADAEPVRHAHWIGRGGIFSCSHCGAEDGVMTSFCSSCGFRMDGDAE